MNDEGKALAERLVECVGWVRMFDMVLTSGDLWTFQGTEAGQPVGAFINRETGGLVFASPLGDVPDLDHPSNEGHLRLLAEEVLGRPVGIRFANGGWRVECTDPTNVMRRTYPTPGQAYAAVIVAAKEQG